MKDKIPQEEWWINKSKPDKKTNKSNTQKHVTPKDVCADAVPHSGSRALRSSGAHLMPNGSTSSYKDDVSKRNSEKSEVKFTGVHEASKYSQIKVNHQMDDVILLWSAPQETMLKQIDCLEKKFFGKKNYCTQ